METFMALGWVLLILEGLAFIAWRSWQRATRLPPQPPDTPAQMANAETFDAEQRSYPHMRRARLQRRTARGRRRRQL